MMLLNMKFSPLLCHLVPFWSKHDSIYVRNKMMSKPVDLGNAGCTVTLKLLHHEECSWTCDTPLKG
jgi:hypothetical protein